MFLLSFENETSRRGQTGYYLPEGNDYNVKIDGWKVFDQPLKNCIKTIKWRNENFHRLIRWLYNWLLDYAYFKENYNLIAIDQSKQQALDADPKAIWKINFMGNLECAGRTAMFFITEEIKETNLGYFIVNTFYTLYLY